MAHTSGRANTSLWSNATTNVGNKVAQTSATCLFGGSFLPQLMPQAAQSFAQPRPISRLVSCVGRPYRGLVYDIGNNGRSQSLSVGRAALLMRAHERLRGRPYTLALALRADVALGSPFALASMDPRHVWLPAMCGSVVERQS